MLKGEVPIDLTPTKLQYSGQQLFSDSPMHIQLTGSNWDINFIKQFSPDIIEKINGRTDVNVEVSGRRQCPLPQFFYKHFIKECYRNKIITFAN